MPPFSTFSTLISSPMTVGLVTLMTLPNLTFTELRGFHGAFATGVASQQGALTLPDTWFRPSFWDLLMLQLLRPNSSNLPCLYSTFHLEYPLVLSRFYLGHINMYDRSLITAGRVFNFSKTLFTKQSPSLSNFVFMTVQL